MLCAVQCITKMMFSHVINHIIKMMVSTRRQISPRWCSIFSNSGILYHQDDGYGSHWDGLNCIGKRIVITKWAIGMKQHCNYMRYMEKSQKIMKGWWYRVSKEEDMLMTDRDNEPFITCQLYVKTNCVLALCYAEKVTNWFGRRLRKGEKV